MSRSYTPLKPGWKMTQGQWSWFWRLWADACRAQGWDKLMSKDRDVKRKEVLLELGFDSATDVDKTDGFDRVKRRFKELAGKVHATAENDGERVRLLHRIGEAATELGEAGCPGEYINSILTDFGVVPGVKDITDLPTSDLLHLSVTFTARLDYWKSAPT